MCLHNLGKRQDLKTIGFQEKIGCGLAQGDLDCVPKYVKSVCKNLLYKCDHCNL